MRFWQVNLWGPASMDTLSLMGFLTPRGRVDLRGWISSENMQLLIATKPFVLPVLTLGELNDLAMAILLFLVARSLWSSFNLLPEVVNCSLFVLRCLLCLCFCVYFLTELKIHICHKCCLVFRWIDIFWEFAVWSAESGQCWTGVSETAGCWGRFHRCMFSSMKCEAYLLHLYVKIHNFWMHWDAVVWDVCMAL